MTTWLEFRSEPLTDVPLVQIIMPTFGKTGFLVECLDLQCGYNDVAVTDEEANDLKNEHLQWHEDGMPE